MNIDFKKSNIKHPIISGDGLMQSHLLHIFFDIETGADYPDGDEFVKWSDTNMQNLKN